MAKRTVRFAVGTADGPQSPVYSVFFSTTKADVYVSGRAIAHEVKASLHASGRWRIGFVSQSADAAADNQSTDRAFIKWQRPTAFEPGLTRGLQIVVPNSVVTTWNALLENPDRVMWVPTPPAGRATYFDVILSAPGWKEGARGARWPGGKHGKTTCLFSHPLCNGETVWVVWYKRPFDEDAWVRRFQIEQQPINIRTTHFAVHKTQGYGVYVEMPLVDPMSPVSSG